MVVCGLCSINSRIQIVIPFCGDSVPFYTIAGRFGHANGYMEEVFCCSNLKSKPEKKWGAVCIISLCYSNCKCL